MKQQYLNALKRKLFVKYLMIVAALCIGGASLLYLFDNVLNGVVIDFLRILAVNKDPFTTFKQIFSVFLPTVIVITGFVLIYFLCKDLSHYMRILMDGIDDVVAKKRSEPQFPKEMKYTKDLLMQVANEYQHFERATQEDEDKKKDLIYLLAQDIKFPLSNILMYLEFLEKEKRIHEDIRKDYVHQILQKSLHLEDMMNEFFDITRFNLQYAKWNPEHMYLDRMLEQVIDEYYQMMEEKGIQVNLNSSHQLALFADNDKIARVMRDLLRNLIMLGKKDSQIQIIIQEKEHHYMLSLRAQSMHLSAYQIAHIFHNYYRLKDVQGEDKQHVLGLGIAKQIMDMHKGVLRASSIGDELTFYVDLPKDGYHVEDYEEVSK